MAKSYLAANLCFMGSTILFFGLLMASLHTTSAQVGVCYGRSGNNLPSPREVVGLYNQYNIRKMRIYEPDPATLDALRRSNIELTMGIHNEELQRLATTPGYANNWVQNNIRNYNNVQFRYITVGNEVKPSDGFAQFLVPAMEKIRDALAAASLSNQIKVTTPIDTGTLGPPSFPPSKGYFRQDYLPIIVPVIRFLVSNQAPLFVSIYPFAAYESNNQIPLQYALFQSQTPVVNDPPYQYYNLFDALLDTVYAAVDKVKADNNIGRKLLADAGGGTRLIAGESGWPSNGHGPRLNGVELDAGATNLQNAGTYYRNLINHVKKGTPRKPGFIETFIFAMFDENNKPAQGAFDVDMERSFGLFYPDKRPKYGITNFN